MHGNPITGLEHIMATAPASLPAAAHAPFQTAYAGRPRGLTRASQPSNGSSQMKGRGESRIRRVLRLVNIMRGGTTYGVNELMRKLGVSRRTIYRDLEILSSCGMPCRFDPVTHTYRMDPVAPSPASREAMVDTAGSDTRRMEIRSITVCGGCRAGSPVRSCGSAHVAHVGSRSVQ